MARRARLALAAAALAVGVCPPGPAAAQPVELIGTWHVLVHYQDRGTNHPDWWRWDDRIWEFEMEGSRLRWREYPIVVFEDASGRFEKLGTNRQSRVIGRWEPNESQLAQIQSGLEINTRGSKTKTLRGSALQGWSSGRPRGPTSAMVLTYDVTWSIEDPAGKPVFRIEESLGGASAESLDGVTLYETEAVEPGGDVLRGRFNRDGARVGTFRLTRAGGVGEVKGSGRDQEARSMDMLASQFGLGESMGELLAGRTPESGLPDALRAELRAEVLAQLEEQVRETGNDPRRLQPELNDLADQIVRELESGKSPAQVERMLREGEIRPRGGPLR